MVTYTPALQDKIRLVLQRLWKNDILVGNWSHAHKANDLLAEALVHSSALTENVEGNFPKNSNEKLEWYGDKVINLMLRIALLKFLPSHLVADFGSGRYDANNNNEENLYNQQKSNKNLSQIVTKLELDKALFLGKGQQEITEKMRADGMEAIIGALMMGEAKISWARLINVFFPDILKRTDSYSIKLIELSEDDAYLRQALLAAIRTTGPKAKTHRERGEQRYYYSNDSLPWPTNVNGTFEGCTLLSEAITYNHLDVAKWLVEKGADVFQTHIILTKKYDEKITECWNTFINEQITAKRYNAFLKADSPLKVLILDLSEEIRAAILNESNNRRLTQSHLYTLGIEVYKWGVAQAIIAQCTDKLNEADLNGISQKLILLKDVNLLYPHLRPIENLSKQKINADLPAVNDILILLGAIFLNSKWNIARKNSEWVLSSEPDTDINHHQFILNLIGTALKPRVEEEIKKWQEEKKQATINAEKQRQEAEAARMQQQIKPTAGSSNSKNAPVPRAMSTNTTAPSPTTLYFNAAMAHKRTYAETFIAQAKRNNGDINVYSHKGFTPLLQAINEQKPENAIALLNAGADPNKRHKNTNESALDLAKKHGLTSVINHIRGPM